jgi:hypothetical protein
MHQNEDFLSTAEHELIFVRDLLARIECGSLDPVGLDRDASIVLLIEYAEERRRLIERLRHFAADGGPAWSGAPV